MARWALGLAILFALLALLARLLQFGFGLALLVVAALALLAALGSWVAGRRGTTPPPPQG